MWIIFRGRESLLVVYRLVYRLARRIIWREDSYQRGEGGGDVGGAVATECVSRLPSDAIAWAAGGRDVGGHGVADALNLYEKLRREFVFGFVVFFLLILLLFYSYCLGKTLCDCRDISFLRTKLLHHRFPLT